LEALKRSVDHPFVNAQNGGHIAAHQGVDDSSDSSFEGNLFERATSWLGQQIYKNNQWQQKGQKSRTNAQTSKPALPKELHYLVNLRSTLVNLPERGVLGFTGMKTMPRNKVQNGDSR
jgi:hypothetical protein